MPTVPKGMIIKIKSTQTSYAGEKIKVTNLTSGGTIYAELSSKKECIVAPNDYYDNWVAGDSIIVESHGRIQGYATATLKGSGAEVTMNDAVDTSSVAVDL